MVRFIIIIEEKMKIQSSHLILPFVLICNLSRKSIIKSYRQDSSKNRNTNNTFLLSLKLRKYDFQIFQEKESVKLWWNTITQSRLSCQNESRPEKSVSYQTETRNLCIWWKNTSDMFVQRCQNLMTRKYASQFSLLSKYTIFIVIGYLLKSNQKQQRIFIYVQ